jgi:hypothetical protein
MDDANLRNQEPWYRAALWVLVSRPIASKGMLGEPSRRRHRAGTG